MAKVAAPWTGEDEMKAIIQAIEENNPKDRRLLPSQFLGDNAPPDEDEEGIPEYSSQEPIPNYFTPEHTQNPEPPSLRAPHLPNNFERLVLPPSEPPTPTQTLKPSLTASP
jgi:tRNA-dihydrouridine synthase 2